MKITLLGTLGMILEDFYSGNTVSTRKSMSIDFIM